MNVRQILIYCVVGLATTVLDVGTLAALLVQLRKGGHIEHEAARG